MSTGNGDEGIRRHLSRCWVGPAIRRSREENDWRHNTFVRSWLILFKFKDIYGEGSGVIVWARPLSTSKQGILATRCILRQRYCHIDHSLVSIAIPFATLFFVEWPSCDRRPRAISSTDAILIFLTMSSSFGSIHPSVKSAVAKLRVERPYTRTMQENRASDYRGLYLSQPFNAVTPYPNSFDAFIESRIG